MIRRQYRAVRRGLNCESGFLREDLGQKALVRRVEVLHEQKRHSGGGR